MIEFNSREFSMIVIHYFDNVMEINFCNKHDLRHHGSWFYSENKMMVIVVTKEPSL